MHGITKLQAKRLSYVVPGYVWKQSPFNLDLTPLQEIMRSQQGVIVLENLSLPIREYALALLLGKVQATDYHADIGWLSFFPKPVSEFTGSYAPHQVHKVQGVSVKVECKPHELDQVADIVAKARLAIIACDVKDTPYFTFNKTVYRVKAGAGQKVEVLRKNCKNKEH